MEKEASSSQGAQYSVLRTDNASALPSSTSTSQATITPRSKSNVVPLAVGLTLSLLTLAIAVFGIFYLLRRKPAQDETPSEEPLKP